LESQGFKALAQEFNMQNASDFRQEADLATRPRQAGRRTWLSRRELWLFLLLLVSYTFFFPRWADWNQNSRLDLTLAIVDRGTLQIDDYYENTGDYAFFEGHYYSDKAPGTSFLGVPFYIVYKLIASLPPVDSLIQRIAHNEAFAVTLWEEGSGVRSEKVHFALALTFVTFCVVALPSAFLGVLLYRFLGTITDREPYRLLPVLAYGLATPAFAYSNAFFGHQLVATCLFGAFYLLFRLRRGQIGPRVLVPVGALLGFSVVTEYPTALIAAGLFLYAVVATVRLSGLRVEPQSKPHEKAPDRRWLVGLVGAALPFGLALIAYNMAIFHAPYPAGYFHSTLYEEQHSSGFLSLSYPRWWAIWGITFGSYRGLFFLAPWLLLAWPGFVAFWRRPVRRTEFALCLYVVISFFLFNGSSKMWQGGWAIGPRYLLPMLPFLVVPVSFALDRWGQRWIVRLLVPLALAWSVFAVWAESLGGQNFPDWTRNPLFAYSLPHLRDGDLLRNVGMALGLSGWASLIPLLVLMTALGGGLMRQIRAEHEQSDAGAPARSHSLPSVVAEESQL
jgi:hypothetical protein